MRKNLTIKEKPPGLAKPDSSSKNSNSSKCENSLIPENNSTQNISASSEAVNNKQDLIKGRHFAFVVYPESAPDDWIHQLEATGLPFVVSPLHDKDINPDGSGTLKKAHWHVIVSWANNTTYRTARRLCDKLNCPRPRKLDNVVGAYKYLTHEEHPDKFQYKTSPTCYNGWKRPMDDDLVNKLRAEIRFMVYEQDCVEYGELTSCCAARGAEYLEIVSKNTIFFDRLCSGFRHNPRRILRRILEQELKDNRDSEVFKNCLHTMYRYDDTYELPPEKKEPDPVVAEESEQLPGQMNIADFINVKED